MSDCARSGPTGLSVHPALMVEGLVCCERQAQIIVINKVRSCSGGYAVRLDSLFLFDRNVMGKLLVVPMLAFFQYLSARVQDYHTTFVAPVFLPSFRSSSLTPTWSVYCHQVGFSNCTSTCPKELDCRL